MWSQKKFGVNTEGIDRNVITVHADKDVVSRLDKLGGSVHEILCSQDSLKCHSMSVLACEIRNGCKINKNVIAN